MDIKDKFVNLLEKLSDIELEKMYCFWEAEKNKNAISKVIFKTIAAEKERRL